MKKLRSYGDWRLEKLSDPVRAARYLNAAKKESKEALLYALKNVIQANQVKRVAKEAGISRESVYRSFASSGNPELDTLDGVLDAVNIEYRFFAKGENVRALESDHTKEALVSTGHNPSGTTRFISPELVNLKASGVDQAIFSWEVHAGPYVVSPGRTNTAGMHHPIKVEEKLELGTYQPLPVQ